MDPGEIGWEVVDRTFLAQDRRPVASSCEQGTESSGFQNRRTISDLAE